MPDASLFFTLSFIVRSIFTSAIKDEVDKIARSLDVSRLGKRSHSLTWRKSCLTSGLSYITRGEKGNSAGSRRQIQAQTTIMPAEHDNHPQDRGLWRELSLWNGLQLQDQSFGYMGLVSSLQIGFAHPQADDRYSGMREDHSVVRTHPFAVSQRLQAENDFYSSNAIDEALLRCSSGPATAVAYFYFDFNDREKQSLENLVSSLTLQLSLLGEMDSRPLEELYTVCQYGQRQPSLSELTATLRWRLQELETTYIIIDAVDECKEVESFLEFVQDLLAWNFDTLHFLATSRHERELRLFFDACSATVVPVGIASTTTNDDISTFIHQTIIDDPKLQRWPKEVLEDIETTLKNGGDGMYRTHSEPS